MDGVKKIKATQAICERCDHSHAFPEKDKPRLVCFVNCRKFVKDVDDGVTVAIYQSIKDDKPADFSTHGPWYVPAECPFILEQEFSQQIREEEEAEKK